MKITRNPYRLAFAAMVLEANVFLMSIPVEAIAHSEGLQRSCGNRRRVSA